MKNVEVARQLQRLRALMRTAVASTNDLSLKGEWARYFCVLASGFLENSISEIYGEFVARTAHPAVANYAISRLDKIQNPKTDKFIETARSFDRAWGDALEIYVSREGRKDAIDSIMNNRHQIAHGKSVGVTYAQVESYLDRAVEVLEFIETQTRP